MDVKRKAMLPGGAALGVAADDVGVASAVGGSEQEKQATGPGAEHAKAAALRIIRGEVNTVERDSERRATSEVEVRKPAGSTVDVRLNDEYQQMAVDADSETADGPP